MSKIRDLVAEQIRQLKDSGKEYGPFIVKVALTPPEFNQFYAFRQKYLMTGRAAPVNGREFGGAEPGHLALQPHHAVSRQRPDALVPVELSFRYNEDPPEGFTQTDAPISPDFEGLGDADEASPVVFGVDFDELP